MLDFSLMRNRKMTLAELVGGLTVEDLKELTHEMIDEQLRLITDCDDTDVVFVPVDENAVDRYAADPTETNMPWTLGHVIVHVTASSEEKAFLAAEQARGINREGRSRYETSWQTITTIEQCRARLEESRRMRVASLDMWPDEPHLDLTIRYQWLPGPMNAIARYVMGLYHDADHLGQIAEIVRQAREARREALVMI
jgi:hypothetical protein